MDIQQLRYYLSLAEHLNYTRAAEEMFVSRQAVSQSVRLLEAELSAKLVLSENGRIRLTPLGQKVYEDARVMVAEFDRFSSGIRGYITAQSGSLKVVTGAAVLRNFPPDMLLRFSMLYSDILLSATEADNTEMRSLLDHQKADICLMGTSSRYLRDYRYTILKRQELTVLVNRKNPLSRKQQLTIQDLRQQPMIGHGEAYDLHRFYVDACHAAGFEPCFSMISTNVDLILQLLQQNRTLCFGTRSSSGSSDICPDYAVSLPLVLPEPEMEFGIYAVTSRDRPLQEIQKTFIRYLSEECGPQP